jgi:pimeloyl-ACP methyl ester carboxylesterase
VRHRYATIDGRRLFYREAGDVNAPAVVLLHGFPTSSFMFRNLIAALADRYHVIAPDHLGFGLSDAPTVGEFDYTFDALTDLTAHLLDHLNIARYAIYVQDYGAPIGWRLALRDPQAITAIVTQNGNGYDEGFVNSFWKTVWDYHREQNPETEAAIRGALSLESTKWQYLAGVADETLVDPTTWERDFALLSRPGNDEVQLKLFLDYATNSPMYPALTTTCVTARFRCWPYGARATRSSDPTGHGRSPRTRPTPRSTSSTAGISCWRAQGTKSPR